VTAFVSGGFLPAAKRGTNSSFLVHICDVRDTVPTILAWCDSKLHD
jgi:hypothetical protein